MICDVEVLLSCWIPLPSGDVGFKALFPIGLLALPSGPDAMFFRPKTTKATSSSQRLLDPPQYLQKSIIAVFRISKGFRSSENRSCSQKALIIELLWVFSSEVSGDPNKLSWEHAVTRKN